MAYALFALLIKSVTLDLRQRPMCALLLIDDFLELLLDFGNLIRIVHDFHSRGGVIDKGIERNQT